MTDVLQARFEALADRTDDSDWRDVRRRAGRSRRPLAVVLAATAAAAIAAAALAAGNGWLFSSHDRAVTAQTRVALHGRTWTVSVTTRGAGLLSRFCVRASGPGATESAGCGRTTSGLLGPPFGARHVDVDGGQIWVGVAVGFTRRISITDADGRVRTATAVRPRRGTKTPFRYWVLALEAPARSITAYDARGRSITKRL